LALLVCIGALSPASADEAAEALTAAAEIESRLLEAEMLRYDAMQRSATAAMVNYVELEKELDAAIVAEGRSTTELRTAESTLAAARDNAYGLARQAETLRRSIYDHMDRVGELRGAGDRLAARRVKSPLEGVWTVTTTAGESGHARFMVDGALVRGTYRLGEDNSGSLRGTFVDGVVDLEQIGASRGFGRILSGKLDGALLEGNWIATEISGGKPQSGRWTGRKLSGDEAKAIGSLP